MPPPETIARVAWLAAALLGHAALCVEFVNRSHGLIPSRPLMKAASAAGAAALFGVPLFAAWRWANGLPQPEWLGYYAAIAVVGFGLAAVSRVARRFDPLRDTSTTVKVQRVDLGERLGDAAMGSPALARVARWPGNQVLDLRVERRELPTPRLPPECDGLRIAHLTDLHMSGRLRPCYFEEVTRLASAFSPDMVCLTGDVVETPDQLDWIESVLAAIAAPPLGAYFVLGNHDVKSRPDEQRARLEAIGFADAARRPIAVRAGERVLTVCGDERPWFPAGPMPTGDEEFVVCLAHSPDRFASAARRGDDLVLAGHTHGGQIGFPLIGPLVCPSHHGVRFASGTFRRGRTVMHVSRGTGSLFPLRYRCPPELGLMTLRRGGGGARGDRTR